MTRRARLPLVRRDVIDRNETEVSTYAATSFASFLLHRHAAVPDEIGRSALAARPRSRDAALDRGRVRR
jgi:hypothetical protein